jgi:hypothetical protein
MRAVGGVPLHRGIPARPGAGYFFDLRVGKPQCANACCFPKPIAEIYQKLAMSVTRGTGHN